MTSSPFIEQVLIGSVKAIGTFKKIISRGYNFSPISTRGRFRCVFLLLDAARQSGTRRNLVIAATGADKTVISALDYKRYVEAFQWSSVAHVV